MESERCSTLAATPPVRKIYQHYEVYQQWCKDANIPEHLWEIPRIIWQKMEEEQRGKKVGRHGTLDGFIRKPAGPIVYMHENVLHVVTQFVAVNY